MVISVLGVKIYQRKGVTLEDAGFGLPGLPGTPRPDPEQVLRQASQLAASLQTDHTAAGGGDGDGCGTLKHSMSSFMLELSR